MITKLPPELILHILNFLHNSKAALSACFLCSSALATLSKPLLFHTLRTSLDPNAADRFKHLLDSNPTVLPLVKRIDVAVSAFEQGAAATTTAISRIMACYRMQSTRPALNIAVRPTCRKPYQFMKSVPPWLDPVVDLVTSLELDGLDLAEDIQFWDLVLKFRMLKSLVLGRVCVGEGGVYIPSHPESPISHLTLKESSWGGSRNVCWLLACHPMPLPSLKSLDVRFPMELNEAAIRFGQYCGPMVRTLRFGVVISRHSSKFLDQILDPTTEFISKFNNLETLTFQGLFVPTIPPERHPVTFEWIPIALRGVSPTVQKFTVEVVVGHLSHLHVIPWAAIDEILAHQLRSVTGLEILLATPFGMNHLLDDACRDMEGRLPLAAQRGVLRCSAVAEHPI